ncbi:hypothetical protein JXA12_03140 [Candidatus Woesearchaeota archaeon]|nr:hypothetical protein [Candidatus Woesearchaeota archaeon]
MQWQHYSSVKSAMWYIEGLLHEIELSLREGNLSYHAVEIDLTKKQINDIMKQVKALYSILKKAKKDFNLNSEPVKLSRIIDVNTGYIWKTVEDSWSSEIEKKSGKISSAEQKKQLDILLSNILELTNKIRSVANEHSLG